MAASTPARQHNNAQVPQGTCFIKSLGYRI
jgi:hypothetical protein